MASKKKLNDSFFLHRNTERWPVYFRPGAMFGIFVLTRKNRTGTTRGNGSPAYVAVRVRIPKSWPCTHHLPKAKYAAGAAQQSPVDLLSARQRDLTVLLLVRGPHTKRSPCPMDRAPIPGCAAESAVWTRQVQQNAPFLERGSLKETKGNNQKR